MLYYVGKGTEFKKEECKEYKTIEGALKAAAKDENLAVWDETGAIVGLLTDDVQDGAMETAQEEAEASTEEEKDTQTEKTTPEDEKAENEANTTSEENEVIIPQGTMMVTVICDGTLNLRRSASWESGNECGRAARGQRYYVKAIHTVAGKKMVETVDGIYLSGQSEHVQFEQL